MTRPLPYIVMGSGLLILTLVGIVRPLQQSGEAAFVPPELVDRQDELAVAQLALTERHEELAERQEEFADGGDRYEELSGLEPAGVLSFQQQAELTALRRAEWEVVVALLRVEIAEREAAVAELRVEVAKRGTEVAVPTTRGPGTTLAGALRLIMQGTISLLVLSTALYVLRVRRDPPQWAAGVVGAIVGYWMPG